MKTFVAYGRSIESDYYFDALPETGNAEDSILINVQRVSSIAKDHGRVFRPGISQNRTVHVVCRDLDITVQVDLILSCKLHFSSKRIECLVLNSLSDALLNYWILQQIIPLYLLLNGSTEFLHGMAVSSHTWEEDSKDSLSFTSMAFLGESYAGKSTLLNYFLTRGHALVTDDHVALSRQNYIEALPSTPYYRPYRAPEDLGIVAAIYSPNPSKLERIYLVNPEPAGSALRLDSLSGMAAITALFPHIHYSLHNPERPDFFPLVEDRFRGLADITRSIPIARLHVPRSLERLPEVYDFIQADLMSNQL